MRARAFVAAVVLGAAALGTAANAQAVKPAKAVKSQRATRIDKTPTVEPVVAPVPRRHRCIVGCG